MNNDSTVPSSGSDGGKWDGFSDYNDVSRRIVNAVDLAAECEATLRSRHREGAKISPELASELRSGIQSAINKVYPEIEREAERGEIYKEYIEKLDGKEDAASGLIEAFHQANFQREAPNEINELVKILRKAAWELGYYQAGYTQGGDDDDSSDIDGEVRSMIEGM
jgi:hypothetical protein